VDYSFTKFVELPKEIRLLIWEFALPGPRVVLFEPVLFEEGPDGSFYSFKTQASIILFQVCRESYDVASKVYQKYLLTDSPYSGLWFNHQLDMIYINHTRNINPRKPLAQLEEFAEQAETFAVFFRPDVLCPQDPAQHLQYSSAMDQQLAKLLHLFKNVKTATLAAKRHDVDNINDLVLDWDRPDIDACLQFYKEPFDEVLDQKYSLKAIRYAAAIDNSLSPSTAGTRGLMRRLIILARGINSGLNVNSTYPLPEIKHAIVTTSYLHRKLEIARLAYEEQKAMVMGIEVE
jgi:hypothetical protein